MADRSHAPRLADILEAIERIRHVLGDASLEAFEADWERQWLVERGVEIVSEASRHLPPELKVRHPEVPWQKVAGIGNVLRHNYENIAAAVMWKLARNDLDALEQVCRDEQDAAKGQVHEPEGEPASGDETRRLSWRISWQLRPIV